jgi:hypothetical protein
VVVEVVVEVVAEVASLPPPQPIKLNPNIVVTIVLTPKDFM